MSRARVMQHLPDELAAPLRRFVRQRRQASLLRSLAVVVLVVALWLIAWGVVDRFLVLPPQARQALLVVLCLSIAWILRRPLGAIFHRQINWQSAAWQYEQRDGQQGQRLVTVVSQLLASPDSRGSMELTSTLLGEVTLRLREWPVRPRNEFRAALRAWVVAVLAMGVVGILARWSWFDLPSLLVRQLTPWARATAVTTSRVEAMPGLAEVIQGRDLTIFARVENPGREGVILRTSTDGRNWTSTGMTLSADGRYIRTLSGLSRDTQYEVRTGDAVSGPFPIRVLHHPIVRRISVRLDYPPYVGREPLTREPDSPIEVPAGTRAQITVESSEPLRSAWFIVNGRRTEAAGEAGDRTRQIELPISHDTQIGLEMVSERGVSNSGPTEFSIRAIADRPPFARLLVPSGFLLLQPQAAIHLPYEAIDDYAIASLHLRIEADGVPLAEDAVPRSGDLHVQEGMIRLDLSRWNVRMGQLLTLTLVAGDRAGQPGPSAPVRAVVSADTILPEQRRRIAEWRDAAQLAASAVAELDAARIASERPSELRGSDQRPTAPRLAVAAERTTLLLRSLVRASSGMTESELLRLLERLMDQAQVQSIRLDEANAAASNEPMADLRERIAELYEQAVQIERSARQLWQGQAAEVVLAERRALVAVQAQVPEDLAQLREAIEAEIHQLSIEPRMLDLDALLQARVEAGRELIRTSEPLDLTALLVEWSRSDQPRAVLLPERLTLLAQLQAVRGDADLTWARDLQLAARAVRSIESAGPLPEALQRAARRNSTSLAMNVLQQAYESRRRGGAAVAGRDAIDAARRILSSAAGEPYLASGFPSTAPLENRARPTTAPLASAPSVSQTRDRALALIPGTLEMLVELPQLLADVEQKARAVQAAQARWQAALREAAAAPLEERDRANRAVDIALEILNENHEMLADVALAVDFTQPTALARVYRAYLPDTLPAMMPIEGPFAEAMLALRQAIDNRDPEQIERSTAQTRSAIATVQQGLHESRQALLARDPAVFARSFAAATRPTTQAVAIRSLQWSWDDTIRRLTETVPSPAAPQPTFDPARITGGQGGATPAPRSPDLPPRSPLRSWRPDDLGIVPRDADPPQYRDALDAYFHALGAPNPAGP